MKRSPIRILEKTINGGLGAGNLGVFTARKGVGKTACLVHFALDKLIFGQRVLHISFADDPQHIETWYKQVFHEVSSTYKLADQQDIYNQILPNRLILHFKQADLDLNLAELSINRIIHDGSFVPEMLIVDGLPFEALSYEDIKFWKKIAREKMVEIWFSASLHRDGLDVDEKGIPAPINKFYDLFSVIILLNPCQDYVDLKLLKDHDSTDLKKLRLKLDPKTLLIANRRLGN